MRYINSSYADVDCGISAVHNPSYKAPNKPIISIQVPKVTITMSANEEYQGGEAVNDDYVNRPGQDGGVPVVSDKNTADEGGYTNPEQADSDAQLR